MPSYKSSNLQILADVLDLGKILIYIEESSTFESHTSAYLNEQGALQQQHFSDSEAHYPSFSKDQRRGTIGCDPYRCGSARPDVFSVNVVFAMRHCIACISGRSIVHLSSS